MAAICLWNSLTLCCIGGDVYKRQMYLFYREAFVAGNKGYASAIVIWTIFLIGIVTVIQFIGQKKWVNYDV